MSQSLLIIGPDIATRGVGGVTVHVKRLREYLQINNIQHDFLDSRSNKLSTLCREIAKHDIIHLHLSNPIYQFILVVFCRLMRKSVIMTLHGDYGRFGRFKNCLVRISIEKATIPIVINKKSYEACKSYNKYIRLIPAFIPPQKLEQIQEDIISLLDNIRKQGKKIVSTNASTYSIDKNGNEIYGISFLIDYFKDRSDMALVISDPSSKNADIYNNMTLNNVYFINYPHPYYEVLKRVDYFVRNTSTDGDALSVKESLFLGITTLCSRSVDRPQGVILFNYCDLGSFDKAIKEVKPVETELENGAVAIVQVYNEIERA